MVCSEGIEVCVGYTSYTCNMNDNSKTTSKSILMFIMPHEMVIITNVTLFETGFYSG